MCRDSLALLITHQIANFFRLMNDANPDSSSDTGTST